MPAVSSRESAPPLVPEFIGRHSSCLLVKIGQVVFRLMEQQLASLGLRTRHYSILQTLINDGAMSQHDLSTFLRIDTATMVASVDDVERLGLVARERDHHDRRRYVVSVTDRGRSVAAAADDLLESLDDLVLAALSPAERAEFQARARSVADSEILTRTFDAARGK